MFPLQLQICIILLCNQVIKRNNQIIRTNNQIFKILIAYIRPRLADVGSNQIHEQYLPIAHLLSGTLCYFNLVGLIYIIP